MRRHLHILTQPKERLQRIHLIEALAGIWREQGDAITYGDRPPPETDAVIVHTDNSTVEDELFAHVGAGVPVVNLNARSILKSRVSQLLLDRQDSWDGPVIIKTDANCHAGEEYAYHGLDIPRLVRIFAGRVLPWQWTGELPFRRYPILDSKEQVPDWVWNDKRLVVDKFAPERDGELYVLRLWMFFGEEEYCMRVTSDLPVVKSRRLIDVKLENSVPDSVRAIRRKHGLDFGKIDFVIRDGEAFVFDVNKTPTVHLNKKGKPGPFVQRLARGLDGLLQ